MEVCFFILYGKSDNLSIRLVLTNLSTLLPVWFKKDHSKADLMFNLFDKDCRP